jgi:hypothetical protein
MLIDARAKAILRHVVVLIFAAVQAVPSAKPDRADKSVDPSAFSLRGLRLYMTSDEAVPVLNDLIEEYGDRTTRSSESYGPCVKERIAALMEHREPRDFAYTPLPAGTVCVTGLSFGGGNGNLEVRLKFAEDVKTPGTMRLWHINFFQANMPTAADARAFFAAVVQKYGAPTAAGPDGLGPVIYCSETGPAKTCRIDPYVTGNYDASTDSAKLECCSFAPQLARKGFYARRFGNGVAIDLWDVAFRVRLAQDEQKMIDNTRTTGKPIL